MCDLPALEGFGPGAIVQCDKCRAFWIKKWRFDEVGWFVLKFFAVPCWRAL